MKNVRLDSVSSDTAIEFFGVDGDYFQVALTAPDHSASRRVYAYTDPKGIARLFVAAATDWKGWDGFKEWESIEKDFRIELSIDHFGHVTLRIRLRSDPGGADPWQCDAVGTLESGQLERLAGNVARLWANNG